MNTRVNFSLMALGGIGFIAGGMTHPGDSGTGSKIEQLHEMLVHGSWYPSHALLLLGMVGFACGCFAMVGRGPASMRRLTRWVSVLAAISVVGMVVHLLGALNAPHIADGTGNWFSTVQAINETGIQAVWALGFTAVAVVGGLTRSVGNVVTAALGLVGGLAFALASATVPFTDRFDMLFPVGALLGLWAIVVGTMGAASAAEPAPRRLSDDRGQPWSARSRRG